jgi:hypothetical protein
MTQITAYVTGLDATQPVPAAIKFATEHDPNTGIESPHAVIELAGVPVSATNPLPVTGTTVTFSAGNADVVASGNTAVQAIIGPCAGAYIVNPDTDAGQNVISGAEPLLVDPVRAPAAGSAAYAFGTTSLLNPGGVWSLPGPIPAGTIVYVNAATSGHRFTCVVWA